MGHVLFGDGSQQSTVALGQGFPLDQELTERLGLLRNPRGNRGQKGVARDEIHLKRKYAEE
jgi:hypothetical protein